MRYFLFKIAIKFISYLFIKQNASTMMYTKVHETFFCQAIFNKKKYKSKKRP